MLDRGFRVPAAVIDFAARLLPVMAPELGAPVSVRDDPGRLDLVHVRSCRGLVGSVAAAAEDALDRPGSVGLIAADAPDPRARGCARRGRDRVRPARRRRGHDDVRLSLVPASIAKGLEFDWVVVVEPAEIVAAEPRGLRRLYVVLTRAVSGLAVVHAEPLPDALTG